MREDLKQCSKCSVDINWEGIYWKETNDFHYKEIECLCGNRPKIIMFKHPRGNKLVSEAKKYVDYIKRGAK